MIYRIKIVGCIDAVIEADRLEDAVSYARELIESICMDYKAIYIHELVANAESRSYVDAGRRYSEQAKTKED